MNFFENPFLLDVERPGGSGFDARTLRSCPSIVSKREKIRTASFS